MSTGSTYGDFVQRVEKQVAAEMTDPLIGGLNEDVARKIAEFGAGDGLPSADVAKKAAEVAIAKWVRDVARKVLAKVMEAAKAGEMYCTLYFEKDLNLERRLYNDPARKSKLRTLLEEKGYLVSGKVYYFQLSPKSESDYITLSWSDLEL